MGKKKETGKKEWKPPARVKKILTWAKKKNLDILETLKSHLNHVKFKKNLMVALDVDTDMDDVGKILSVILDYVETEWKPSEGKGYDIFIKFT